MLTEKEECQDILHQRLIEILEIKLMLWKIQREIKDISHKDRGHNNLNIDQDLIIQIVLNQTV